MPPKREINLKTYFEGNREEIIAGLDEAGQGPLLGRVYGAAVILSPEIEIHEYLNDSKKMTPRRRAIVRTWIEENAVAYSVCWRDEQVIDQKNILQAKLDAWHECIDKLSVKPHRLLVDGTQFRPYWVLADEGDDYNIPHHLIIKGDAQYACIAAASVLAKEYHDDYIRELCESEPRLDNMYCLLSNKGYGTGQHIWGIKEYGPCRYHRRSFIQKIDFPKELDDEKVEF